MRASGRQPDDEHVLCFVTRAVSDTDDEFRDLVSRGFLSSTDIAAEYGIANSVLAKNRCILGRPEA